MENFIHNLVEKHHDLSGSGLELKVEKFGKSLVPKVPSLVINTTSVVTTTTYYVESSSVTTGVFMLLLISISILLLMCCCRAYKLCQKRTTDTDTSEENVSVVVTFISRMLNLFPKVYFGNYIPKRLCSQKKNRIKRNLAGVWEKEGV